MLLIGISTLIIAMGVSWAITPLVIVLAKKLGAVDIPGGRKTHRRPTPRIGGISVYFGFVAGFSFAAYVTGNLTNIPSMGVYWQGLAIAGTALLLIGLIDDVRGLSFYWKLSGQILAAAYVWQCGFRIESLTHPFGGANLELDLLSFPITVLWIVAITNAVNLIDGLDGLAAGVALITTLAMAMIAFMGGRLGTTAASITLAGSLIGFLRYNFNPARIFLGDSGSLFIGFVLAVVSVRGSQKGTTAVAVMVPLLVLGLPLLDTSLAVVRRLLRLVLSGQRSDGNTFGYVLRNIQQVFLPDRGHIHHGLQDMGLSHRTVVLVLYGLCGLFALAAFILVLVKSVVLAVSTLALLGVLLAALILMLYLRIWRPDQEENTLCGSDDEVGRAPELRGNGSRRHLTSNR
jgi:UDP-GlcNAc:undecaprenyl-phosphate GlcNAc-1-phosphate transferase